MKHSEAKKIIAGNGVTVHSADRIKGGLRYNVTGIGDDKTEKKKPKTLTVTAEEMSQ